MLFSCCFFCRVVIDKTNNMFTKEKKKMKTKLYAKNSIIKLINK